MSSIGPGRLDDRRAAEDVFVLDIRPADAYRDGHIEGSHNAPVYDDVREGEVEALDPHLDELPEDGEIEASDRPGHGVVLDDDAVAKFRL